MPDVDARLDKVEEGLKELGKRVDKGFGRIDERFTQMDERLTQIDKRFAQIDEVQGHHGQKLEQLVEAVAPLKDLRDFVQRVADDHEKRIQGLEAARSAGTHHA